MGKSEAVRRKFDAWFGKGYKSSSLRSYLDLAISRIKVLRNQRRNRWEQARCDVAELVRLGQHDRAVIRAENIIKEKNMLDIFDMLESYCELLSERADLLENQRECPEELREAISGLIFASSRIGQLYELEEVRSIISARLGKEFVSSAVELRNKCGINPVIIVKLSTKQSDPEARRKAAEDVCLELGIPLHLREETTSTMTDQPGRVITNSTTSIEDERMRERYKDAVSAAQAAFESAAYAAAAARVAVDLSRSESNNRRGGQSEVGSISSAASGELPETKENELEKKEELRETEKEEDEIVSGNKRPLSRRTRR